MDYLKTIFFGLTIVILIVKLIIKTNNKNDKFYLSSIFITTLFFASIEWKFHHILRTEFYISNTITFGLISIFVLSYILKFWNNIKYSNYILLIISISFLALAVVFDLLNDAKVIDFLFYDLFEEAIRIVGSLFWVLYYSLGVNKKF